MNNFPSKNINKVFKLLKNAAIMNDKCETSRCSNLVKQIHQIRKLFIGENLKGNTNFKVSMLFYIE